MEDIRVYVESFGRGLNLQMRYTDPVAGKKVTKTTGTKNRKDAQRIAAKWEADLQAGRYKKASKVTWLEAVDRYSEEYLAGLSDGTHLKFESLVGVIRDLMTSRDFLLSKINTRWVSKFRSELRKAGREETTIDSHCRHLKAMLRWTRKQGMLNQVPEFIFSKKSKGQKLMKGRPLNEGEFERMLAIVPFVACAPDSKRKTQAILRHARQNDPERRASILVTIKELSERIAKVSESWRDFLRGLWWSGLRLREALSLSWDEYADGLQVDMSEKYVSLRIPGEHEKGGKDRTYPAAPEFAELLRATPPEQRTGFVFKPLPSRSLKGNDRANPTLSGKTIARIGEAAGVVVDRKGEDVTYASSHDLRRSFGLRWSRRVMPPVLQGLMRHESIDTTMKYYVGQDAQSTAAELYAALETEQNPKVYPNERHAG